MSETLYFAGGIARRWPDMSAVLNSFIANALNHFLIAEKEVTIDALGRYASGIYFGDYFADTPTPISEDCLFFRDIYRCAALRVVALRQAYDEANPDVKACLYGKPPNPCDHREHDPQIYFDAVWKAVPESWHHIGIINFLEGFEKLDKETRANATLAFRGLLFAALHDGVFPSLCKNKNLDASAMTLEQRANEPLDVDALCFFFHDKQGKESGSSVLRRKKENGWNR